MNRWVSSTMKWTFKRTGLNNCLSLNQPPNEGSNIFLRIPLSISEFPLISRSWGWNELVWQLGVIRILAPSAESLCFCMGVHVCRMEHGPYLLRSTLLRTRMLILLAMLNCRWQAAERPDPAHASQQCSSQEKHVRSLPTCEVKGEKPNKHLALLGPSAPLDTQTTPKCLKNCVVLQKGSNQSWWIMNHLWHPFLPAGFCSSEGCVNFIVQFKQ